MSDQASSANSALAKKRKKPAACDLCKQKRVLCHPNSVDGCPRCREKGLPCTTTPTVRRNTLTARKARAPTYDFSTDTAVPKTPVQSTARLSRNPSPSSSLSPVMSSCGPAAPSPVEALQLSTHLSQHLYQCFTTTIRAGHPLVQQCSLMAELQNASWDIEQLSPLYAALACAALAIGALVSFDPGIIGTESQPLTSYLDVERLGPDLRSFGKRRQTFFCALRTIAVRRAKDSDALFGSNVVSAATCWLIDYLEEVGPDLAPSRSGIWLQAYLQQLRVLLTSRSSELVETESSVYACHQAMDLFGRWPHPNTLHEKDFEHLCGLAVPDLWTYQTELQMLSSAPTRTKTPWDARPPLIPFVALCLEEFVRLDRDLLGFHARNSTLNEESISRHLALIEKLVNISTLLNALTDRLFQTENEPEIQLARKPTSREGLIGMQRFTQTACAAALVLPLLEELERREAVLDETSPSFTRERLASFLRQLQRLGHNAARSIMEALAITRDLRCWTHAAPNLLPRWAAFVAERLESGNAHDLLPLAPRYAAALRKLGFSFSSPVQDSLIDRLDVFSCVSVTDESTPFLTPATFGNSPTHEQDPLLDMAFPLPLESNSMLAIPKLYTPAQTSNMSLPTDSFLDLWPW